MVIDMSRYRIKRILSVGTLKTGTYGKTLRTAVPTSAIVHHLAGSPPDVTAPEFPEDFSQVDIQEFLDHLRTLASHI